MASEDKAPAEVKKAAAPFALEKAIANVLTGADTLTASEIAKAIRRKHVKDGAKISSSDVNKLMYSGPYDKIAGATEKDAPRWRARPAAPPPTVICSCMSVTVAPKYANAPRLFNSLATMLHAEGVTEIRFDKNGEYAEAIGVAWDLARLQKPAAQ